MKDKEPSSLTNRRTLLKQLGFAGATIIGAPFLPKFVKAENKNNREYLSTGPNEINREDEKFLITKVEGIRFSDKLNVGGGSGGDGKAEFMWVRLTTNRGLVGYGETYPAIEGELGALRQIATHLIGQDPRDVEKIWKELYKAQAMRVAGGADMQILSAVDMALMDLFGKSTGLPLYRLLGGKTRGKMKVYNTTTDYWAINNMKMGPDTEKIVQFLLDRGITAMKIYPFQTENEFITTEEIDRGVEWLRQIEKTAGRKMEILIDNWSFSDLPSAERILKACEPFNVIHAEDMLLPNSAQSYAALARETSIPIAHSETLGTRYELKDFLEAKAADILMFDLTWCGGVTEAKKMCDMADAYHIPGSPHTCGGPLLWVASTHLTTALANFSYMESNYWKYTHQYPYFISNVPVPVNGYVSAPEKPGLGVEIRKELFENGDAIVEVIAKI